MEPIPIEDLNDPRVAVYRNVRDADLVGRRGCFLAEGELVVRTLLNRSAAGGPFAARSVFLNRTRLDAMGGALREHAQAVPACPVYVAEQAVMDGIVGYHIHRGVLACGQRTREPGVASIIDPGAHYSRRPVVVLEDLANHDNVGGVFRNAAAFGCDGALLTRRCCDPLYRKALRVSMGHVLSTPYAHIGSVADASGALRDAGRSVVALTPDPGAPSLAEVLASGGADRGSAILLGAEGPGLSEEAVRSATTAARIPIEPGVDSLNVVVACAIALSALRG